MVAERRLEHAYFHECVMGYPALSAQEDRLHSTHNVLSITVNPLWYGYPASNARRFTAGLSRSALIYVGPDNVQAEFDRLCMCRLMLSGSVYMQASLKEQLAEVREVASRRDLYFEDDEENLRKMWRATLTLDQLKRLQSWHVAAHELCEPDADVFYDLKDWCRKRDWCRKSKPTPHVPRQHCHSFLFSEELGRPLTSFENICTQGLDLYSSKPTVAITNVLAIMKDLTIPQRQFLVGNSVHIPVYSMFILFVLANCIRRPPESLELFPPAGSDGDEDCSDID